MVSQKFYLMALCLQGPGLGSIIGVMIQFPSFCCFLGSVTKISDVRSKESISRSDVTFTFTKLMQVGAALRMLLEAASWIDCWHIVNGFLVTANWTREGKCHRLFRIGAKTMVMISKTASVLWSNSVIRRHDTELSKISSKITYEHKIGNVKPPLCLHT